MSLNPEDVYHAAHQAGLDFAAACRVAGLDPATWRPSTPEPDPSPVVKAREGQEAESSVLVDGVSVYWCPLLPDGKPDFARYEAITQAAERTALYTGLPYEVRHGSHPSDTKDDAP